MRQFVPQALLPLLSLASACAAPAQSVPEPSKPELVTLSKQGSTAGKTFYVKGRHLYDRCGEKVVLRGVNKMNIWTDPSGQSFPEIRKTGANAVRIVWNVKEHSTDEAFDRVIQRAVDEKLIPMIELHDATGDFDKLAEIMDFWTRPAIVEILKKHEQTLLLNIANEAGNGHVRVDVFRETYTKAVKRLRAAGLNMPLVIDATRWGQDIDMLMLNAPHLLAADPLQNLLFSAHLWWPMAETSHDPGSKQKIKKKLQESVAKSVPLIIGEFAHAGLGCSRFIDHKTILAEAQTHGIGWLAWSWGPGNKDCVEMDMTSDGTFDTLQGWGKEVAITDPASIKNTSRLPTSIETGACSDASR